jgi:hypothetical protein
MWPGLILLCHKPTNVGAKTLVRRRRKLLPAPLWGGDGGGGCGTAVPYCTTPHPLPPPQGGREEFGGPAYSILSAREVGGHFMTQYPPPQAGEGTRPPLSWRLRSP